MQTSAHSAKGAYVAFLAFLAAYYGCAAQSIPALERFAPCKLLIGVSILALAWATVFSARPLRLGTIHGGFAIYVFFLLVLASPLWSLGPRLSSDAAAEAIKYLAAYMVVVNVVDSTDRVRGLLATIALCSLLPALGAIRGYLTGHHLVEGTRAAWIGVFENPNFLAYHLVTATPLALALRESVPANPRGRTIRRTGWLLVVLVYAVAILLTGSRGGALGLSAIVLAWLVRGLARGRLAVGAAVAIAAALLLVPGGPWARAETHATLAGRVDASAQGRIDAWRTAVRIVSARPLAGVGVGAFLVGYEIHSPGGVGPPHTAHNSFLMIAAELGVPALALFVVCLIGAFVRAGPTIFGIGIQCALFGFVVCSLTGGYVFTWPLYLLLGLSRSLAHIRGAS